jgi:hypothetical protein
MLKILHVIFVIATLLAVAYSDEQALMWMLGKKQTLSPSLVATLHTLVSWGLGLLILTGGLLYFRAPQAYLSDPTFIVKMVAIAALIINTYVIERLAPIATSGPYSAISRSERTKLFISGAVSVLGWATALFCGFLLG